MRKKLVPNKCFIQTRKYFSEKQFVERIVSWHATTTETNCKKSRRFFHPENRTDGHVLFCIFFLWGKKENTLTFVVCKIGCGWVGRIYSLDINVILKQLFWNEFKLQLVCLRLPNYYSAIRLCSARRNDQHCCHIKSSTK